MLLEGSSDVTSLVEHPVYSNFKMYSLLILVFLFWFTSTHPKCFRKSNLFLTYSVLRKRSSDIVFFVEHPVYSNFKMYSVLILVFLFWFATIPQKCCKNLSFFEILRALRKKQWHHIASFVEHLAYSIFKMYSVLILGFWFVVTYPKCMNKSHLFWKY